MALSLTLRYSYRSDGKFAQWKARTDGNLIALVYGLLSLLITCGDLPKLKDHSVTENASVMTFLNGVAPAFYTQLMQPHTTLRVRLTELLRDKFHIVSLYTETLGTYTITCRAIVA
jgi:hypothetical protein